MRERLALRPERVRVVYNGISLDGYAIGGRASGVEGKESQGSFSPDTRHSTLDTRPSAPVLGFFARMCREKGLDTLVEAYLILRQRDGTKDLKLRIGGGCGPADEPFVNSLRGRLQERGVLGEVEFYPNLDRAGKLDLLRSLSVFSVPARYGEAFGLYVIEALAAGVPVVQPRIGAFPELLEATGGGVLCEPSNAQALADAIRELLLDPERAGALGKAGRRVVSEKFSAEAMAREMERAFQEIRNPKSARPP